MPAPMKRPLSPRSSYNDPEHREDSARKKSKLGLGISLLVSFVLRSLLKQSSSSSLNHTNSSPDSPTPLSSPSQDSQQTLGRQSSTKSTAADSIPRSSVSTVKSSSDGPVPSYSDLYESIKASREDRIIGDSERRLSNVHGDFVTAASGPPPPLAYDTNRPPDIDEINSASSTIGRVTPQPNISPFFEIANNDNVLGNVHDEPRPYLDEQGNPIQDYPDQYGSDSGSYIAGGHALVPLDEYDVPDLDDEGRLVRPPIISLNPRERYHLLQLKKAIELAELEQQKSKYMIDPHETRSIRLSNSNAIDTSTQTHDLDYLRRSINGKRHVSAARPTSALKRSKSLRRRGFSPGNFMYDKSELPKPKAAPEPLDGYLGTIGAPKFAQRPSSPHKLGLESGASVSQRDRSHLSVRGKINISLDQDYVAKSLLGIRLKPLAATEIKPNSLALPSGAFLFGPSQQPLQSAKITDGVVSGSPNSAAAHAVSDSSISPKKSAIGQEVSSGEKPSLFNTTVVPNFTEPTAVSFGAKPSLFGAAPSKSLDMPPSKPFNMFSGAGVSEAASPAPRSDRIDLAPKKKRRASSVHGDNTDNPSIPMGSSHTTATQNGSAKPLFSVGNIPLSADNAKSSAASGKQLGPIGSLGKIGEVKEPVKPLFSFGQPSISEKKDTPLFASTIKAAPAESDIKPTESKIVDLTQNDVPSSPQADSRKQFSIGSAQSNIAEEKPASLFGKSQAKTTDDKPLFSFGGSDVKTSGSKPSISFGGSQHEKTDDKPIFSFGGSQPKKSDKEPIFSFGESQPKKTDEQPSLPVGGSDAKSTSDKPPFSFGGSDAKSTNDKPSFSFGGSDVKSNGDKPSFSFGGSDGKSNEDKPTFSFGGSQVKPNDDKSGFKLGSAQAKASDDIFRKSKADFSANETSSTGQAFKFGGSAANPSMTGSGEDGQKRPTDNISTGAFSFAPKAVEKTSNDEPKKPFSFTFGAKAGDDSKPGQPAGSNGLCESVGATAKSTSLDNSKAGSTSLFGQMAKPSLNFGGGAGSNGIFGQASTSGSVAQAGSAPVGLVFGSSAQQPATNVAGNGGSRNTSFQFAAGIKPSIPSGSLSAPLNQTAQPSVAAAAPSFNFANASVDPATIFGQAQAAQGPSAFTFGSTAPPSNSSQNFNFGGSSAPANTFGAQNSGPGTAFGAPASAFGGQSSAPANASGAPMNVFGTPATGFGGPVNNTAPTFGFNSPNTASGGMVNNGMMMPQPTHHTTGLFGANAPPAPFAFNGAGVAPGMQPAFPGQVPTPPAGRRLAIPRRRR